MEPTGTEAVILAGGYGIRLRGVIGDIPKSMAPVRNKPFLEYLISWLASKNVTSIVISVGYKADAIVSFFGNEFNGIPIEYVHETRPLGTGGGILNALKNIRSRDFVALNGDTFFPVDIGELISFHRKFSCKITVALKEIDSCSRFGSVKIDHNNNIISFNEKASNGKGVINGGLYVINKDFLEKSGLPPACSFEKDILEKSASDDKVKGLIFNNTFLDIGIPEDYNKAAFVL